MQDYNQHRNGRSLRKYCKDEAIDYNWVMEYRKNYPSKKEEVADVPSFPPLTVTENVKPITGWVLYYKWFTGGRFLKPEFEQCKVSHELSRETLILILSTSVQTKIKI